MITFKQFLEVTRPSEDVPFTVNDKQYLMKFISLGLHELFPFSPITGPAYRIVWMPIEKSGLPEEERYARTGENTVGMVRSLIKNIENLVFGFIKQRNPAAITWMGSDPRLASIWERIGRSLPEIGYMQSPGRPVYVRKDIYEKAHEKDI